MEIPDYKNPFNPRQFEMETYIAKYLRSNSAVDPGICPVMARTIVKVVLGEFHPDMFKEN